MNLNLNFTNNNNVNENNLNISSLTSSKLASLFTSAYWQTAEEYIDQLSEPFNTACREYAEEKMHLIPDKKVNFSMYDFYYYFTPQENHNKAANLAMGMNSNNLKKYNNRKFVDIQVIRNTYKRYKYLIEKNGGVKKCVEKYIVQEMFGNTRKFNYKYTATPQQKINRLLQIKKNMNSGNFSIFSVSNDPDIYNVGQYVNLYSNESYVNYLNNRIANYRRKVNKNKV